MATELLQTRVQIYPTPTCDKVFRRALINYNTNSMFCGFRRNTDACQGDSGGPIFTVSYEFFNIFLLFFLF
jgi:secreted trypsin-like serine protease